MKPTQFKRPPKTRAPFTNQLPFKNTLTDSSDNSNFSQHNPQHLHSNNNFLSDSLSQNYNSNFDNNNDNSSLPFNTISKPTSKDIETNFTHVITSYNQRPRSADFLTFTSTKYFFYIIFFSF